MKHKSLLRIILTITACLWLLTACSEKSQITMTTANDYISIHLEGTGTATINWGDGKSDTYTLPDSVDFLLSPPFTHSYSTATTHTVTITGNRITGLSCSGGESTFNELTSLDVSKNPALTRLDCGGNQLTSLDVSKNTALTWLICQFNQLTALDVSKNTTLTDLSCGHNKLTSLDVSGCAALTYLNCERNKLTSLNVSKNTALRELNCDDNQLTAVALNTLFGTLHSYTVDDRKTIAIFNNPGTNTCNQSIATAKGWTVINLW